MARKGAKTDGVCYKDNWLAIETYNIFCLICAFTQVFLSYLIFADKIEGMAASQSGEVMVARWLCTIILHFSFATENANALKLFKYTCMNFEKFQNPRYALMVIQLQLLLSVFIEIVSMAALNSYNSVGGVVANFLAMTVLRSFDDVFLVQFMNPKMNQFKELEIPRYKFKSDKFVIDETFQVAQIIFNDRYEKVKAFVDVVNTQESSVTGDQPNESQRGLAENDGSKREDDDGKVAPAPVGLPEPANSKVTVTWKDGVSHDDQRQAYKDLGQYMPQKGWFKDTTLPWYLSWKRPGAVMLRLYELEMIIYESFFYTIVPLLGILIYFGNLIWEDAFGYELLVV